MESEKIKAYRHISEVNDKEQTILIQYLIRNKKKFKATYLTNHSLQGTIRLNGKDNPLPSGDGSQVIVIDISNNRNNRIKKLGSLHNRTEINGMTDLINRHKKKFYYRENGILYYEDRLWSELGHYILKPYSNDFIGTLIINEDIGEYPIVLVDFEYQWKLQQYVKDREYKKRSEEYNIVFKREKERDLRRRLYYEYPKIKEIIRLESIKNIELRKCEKQLEDIKNINDREVMIDDKIKAADVRTKAYEIISGRSRKNEKCDHFYLSSDLYKIGFNRYEIHSALRSLEEKKAIYKIIYVDWYISKKYRDISITDLNNLLINENNKTLKIDTFFAIKNFCRQSNYRLGIKKSDLYEQLLKKGYIEVDIHDALKVLEEIKIIYKKSYIYWFSNEYKGELIKEYSLINKIEQEDKETEENVLNEIEEDKNLEERNNMEDDINDFTKRINDKYKKWIELKAKMEERDKLINRIKELEQELKDTKMRLEDVENIYKETVNIESYFGQMIDFEKKVDEKKL